MSFLSQREKKPSGKGGASSSKSISPDVGRGDPCANNSIVIGKPQQQQQLNRFLSKTFHMVNNIDVDVVSWNPTNGDSFVIQDIDEFSQTALPLYFNHSKYSSFVRQLNFYGFSKVRKDCSPLKKEEEKQLTVCFYHEYFRKDRPDLLHKIHRVTKKGRNNDPLSDGQQRIRELQREVDAVHDEIRVLRSQMESKLVEVKRSMQQEYEMQIAKLEETCMGMIVLLQSSTRTTCSSSSSPNIPSSLSSYPHSSILGAHSSCPSSSFSSSMISPTPAGVPPPQSFWPSATIMAPITALRRGSWGAASSSSTTTGPVPHPPPHNHQHHHDDATTHATSSTSATRSSLFSSPGTMNIKSSDTTTLMMLSAAGLIR